MPQVDRNPVRSAQQHTFTLQDLGVVTLHRPSFKDMIAIGRKFTEYSQGQVVTDIDANALIRVRAVMETLTESPLQFDFDDPNLQYECFFTFYSEYLDWLNSFRNPGTTQSTEQTGTPASPPA